MSLLGPKMTAALLPNAKAQFIDSTGKPLVGGKVYFYIPNTSTLKDTYQDSAQTILNTNPVVLDANGQAIIWGVGTYRQVVYDQYNNLIWDQITEDITNGGLGNFVDNVFVSGADFTPGVTAQLTLAANYGSADNIWVFFDGVWQGLDQIQSLVGNVLTFTSPIPVGVNKVYVKGGTTTTIGTPSNGTVTDASVAPGAAIQGTKLTYTLPSAAGAVARIITSRLSDWVSLKDFGAKGDGVTDDTAAVQAACTFVANNNRALYVPSGTYKITSPVTTNYAFTMIGEAQSPSVTPDYPQGVPVVTFLSTVAGDYCFKFGNNYQRGGQLRNFRVFGNGVNGSGVYLHNQGWDGMIDCVTAEGFQQYGVTMDYCQDMHVRSLGIIECGTENTYPSLNMVNGCNSVHFDRLHIEITPYMMNINNGADITFNGCHFEVSEYPSGPITVVNRYSRYSQIIINNGSNHIDFNACLFAPNSVQGVAAHFSVAPTSVGPFMSVQGLKINLRACQFRQTQTGKSSNMISFGTSSSCLVDGCGFDQVYTDQNCIVLSGVTFVNNDITWLDDGVSTLMYGIANTPGGSPSIVDKNRFFQSSSTGATKTAGYLITSQASGSYIAIGYNQNNVTKFYKHHNAASVALSWNQTSNVNLTGFGGTLDLELYDINSQFYVTASSTVSSIINMCSGQRVKLWNNSVGTLTVNNAGNVVLKGATNAALGLNGILSLEESGTGYLIETSRNF